MSKFTLSRNWKTMYGFIGLAWLAIAFYELSGYRSWNWGDIIRFISEIVLAILFLGSLFDNISVNSIGFKYRSLGITYSGKWSDVKGIAEKRYFLWGRLEGFYISKDKLTSGNNLVTAKEYFIPLSQFAAKWQESDFRRQIKEYLPQQGLQ